MGSKSIPSCATGLDIEGLGIAEEETEAFGVLGDASGVPLPNEHELIKAAAKVIDDIRKVVMIERIVPCAQKPTSFEISLTMI